MILGYARVSKGETQDTRLHETALRAAGVERLCTDQASGGRWDQPQLLRLLDQLRPQDVVVVWKLDRLSRSLRACFENRCGCLQRDLCEHALC